MLSDFHPLPRHALDSGAGLARTDSGNARRTRLNDPALVVMTDLQVVTPVTTSPETPIQIAHEQMMHRGVRLLFVTDDSTTLLGLITATDILGEKPMQHIQRAGGTRSEIRVHHVMTPHEQLEVLTLADVVGAKVGHIVATLNACNRQHALVVDREEASGWQMVRGIFSSAEIARQVGIEIPITHKAQTFAEIEAEIAK
jgi:CBS-domain-containing membrane protein